MVERESVIVAMSGGVDSSVAAAILLERGLRVIGATLLMRPCGDDVETSWCCGGDAVESARAVAGDLGIPHHVVPCAEEFEREVLRPAWDEYDRGRTPSPCIACNERIKLGLLMELGRRLGVDRVATGHYARVARDEGVAILRGLDRAKDQSYFLFTLTEAQRRAVMFPLGDLTKGEVRGIAASLGLSCARRSESQDACFETGDACFAEALRLRYGGAARPGAVVDRRGKAIGRHDGIHQYTVGQRKGLRIAVGKRAYVTRVDARAAAVVLSDEPADLESGGLVASRPRWHGTEPEPGFACAAQIRYRHPAAAARISCEAGRILVCFEEPQRAVAPGQAVVFYVGDRVIGGAWIDGPAGAASE